MMKRRHDLKCWFGDADDLLAAVSTIHVESLKQVSGYPPMVNVTPCGVARYSIYMISSMSVLRLAAERSRK